MRILILNWRDPLNPRSGGAEIVTMELAKQWMKQGYSVTWYSSRFTNSTKRTNFHGIKIERYGNYFTVYMLAPIYYLINRKRFDIVIDQIHGLPFLTPLYVGKPVLVIIHEVAGAIWDNMFIFPISKIGKLAELLYFIFYRGTDFMVPSKSTRHELLDKGISRKKITIFNCGVNSLPLQHYPKENDPTFIFVNRLVRMKGVENVINSFPYILETLPNSKLWLVGGGEPEEVRRLKKIVARKRLTKRITFYGRVSEEKKFELMRRAHIMLHASVKEGWGLVVIEAGSQKTPSVVYNVGGLRDSVKDGETGIIVGKNSPEFLAKGATSLFKNKKLYTQMQNNAYKWAKGFTWENCAKPSLKIFKRFISSSK